MKCDWPRYSITLTSRDIWVSSDMKRKLIVSRLPNLGVDKNSYTTFRPNWVFRSPSALIIRLCVNVFNPPPPHTHTLSLTHTHIHTCAYRISITYSDLRSNHCACCYSNSHSLCISYNASDDPIWRNREKYNSCKNYCHCSDRHILHDSDRNCGVGSTQILICLEEAASKKKWRMCTDTDAFRLTMPAWMMLRSVKVAIVIL